MQEKEKTFIVGKSLYRYTKRMKREILYTDEQINREIDGVDISFSMYIYTGKSSEKRKVTK